MLLNVFWGYLWIVVGPLGGHLGVIWALLWLLNGTPNFSNFFFGDPGAPNVPPKQPSTDLNSAPGALIAKQKAPGSHQGPHFGTDAFRYLTILEQNPPTKTTMDIAKAFPRRLWGCRVQYFFFRFCFSFFSSVLSVSFTIIMRLRPRRGLRLELRLRLRMRLGLGL